MQLLSYAWGGLLSCGMLSREARGLDVLLELGDDLVLGHLLDDAAFVLAAPRRDDAAAPRPTKSRLIMKDL